MAAFVGNTNALELTGLKDEVTEAFINDAVVTATVKNAVGAEVAGQSWPLTLEYLSGSDGNYLGFLDAALELVAKAKYTAVIEADGGTDRIGHWEFPFKPTTRTS